MCTVAAASPLSADAAPPPNQGAKRERCRGMVNSKP
jgi:hypothetical protein